MTYKIIRPPSSLPQKFKKYVIPRSYQYIYTSKNGFSNLAFNMSNYNKAVIDFYHIFVELLENEKFFNTIFKKYCKEIIVTSMDRPYSYKTSSHFIPGKACDFVLIPIFLNPLLHGIINKYRKKHNFDLYLSATNHHLHFAKSNKHKYGYEVAFNPQTQKYVLPKRILQNFNKEISSGKYQLRIYPNLQMLSTLIMDYYGMGSLVSSYLQRLLNLDNTYNYVVEKEKIIKVTCQNYYINYNTFIDYLKSKGRYTDLSDYFKKIYPSFERYIKKTVQGSKNLLLLGGGIISLSLAYKYIKLFKKDKTNDQKNIKITD